MLPPICDERYDPSEAVKHVECHVMARLRTVDWWERPQVAVWVATENGRPGDWFGPQRRTANCSCGERLGGMESFALVRRLQDPQVGANQGKNSAELSLAVLPALSTSALR